MNNLNQLILKWADDKGILANGTMIDGVFVKDN